MRHPVIEVMWWKEVNNIQFHDDLHSVRILCRTIGYLVNEDDVVILASTFDGFGNPITTTSIPKGCIISMVGARE